MPGGYKCPVPGCKAAYVVRVLLDDHLTKAHPDHQETTKR